MTVKYRSKSHLLWLLWIYNKNVLWDLLRFGKKSEKGELNHFFSLRIKSKDFKKLFVDGLFMAH